MLRSASPHLTIHGGDQRGCRPARRMGLGEKKESLELRADRGDTHQNPVAHPSRDAKLLAAAARPSTADESFWKMYSTALTAAKG